MSTRERPVLFSGPMVRAILDGTKAQTRRLVKGVALRWLEEDGFTPDYVGDCANSLSPYGVRGERLWVRETWGLRSYTDETDWHRTSVRGADHSILGHWRTDYSADWSANQEHCYWRPSIHMPRWASRITLEVTDVRVERLKDISDADVAAEGIGVTHALDPQSAFQKLWDSINGDRAPWASNPWVWCISFKRVSP